MSEIKKVLSTEYSTRFDDIRKGMMVVSYYKYGDMATNYKKGKTIDCIGSLEKRLQKYKETGNTEYLADIANFAMIEFMYPQHPTAYYKATDSDESCGVVGMGINEIKQFKENATY